MHVHPPTKWISMHVVHPPACYVHVACMLRACFTQKSSEEFLDSIDKIFHQTLELLIAKGLIPIYLTLST